jgi:hypothetical protein
VRNALYLDWKYFGSTPRWLALANGYLVKGAYNRVVGQALHGVADSVRMIKSLGSADRVKLNSKAIEYIRENDLKYRGSLWNRISHEIFTTLPGGNLEDEAI